MEKVYTLMSTGLPELDKVIRGVRPGDNIVWQVDSIDDYIKFVHPFCRDAYEKNYKLIYFRFAEHPSVLPKGVKADTYQLHPEKGFETFLAEIFTVIEKKGSGAFYVFDCLSELTVDWYSDRMLANFFMLTCPYLYDFDTVTYFALMKNVHISHTINAIQNTAQVVIDIYRDDKDLYIHPLKVFKRYTNTMYMLHKWKHHELLPVKNSTVISRILESVPHSWLNISKTQQDMWNRIFEKAQEVQKTAQKNKKNDKNYEEYRQRLLRMVVTRDERVLKLAEQYLSLSDLIDIGKHMIGTGLIGGKTVGMIVARAILNKKNKYWNERLEHHDSFFIGSDVFYTYLIMSKCWWVRWKQRKSEGFLEGAEEAHYRLLSGTFPEDIKDQFREILNYYGQSPIIVRSSSLLEDAYGNSFSGKYESVFCVNQGTPEERLEEFINAVRSVYASTMSNDALIYRNQRGLLDRDEQMALLVQRVSGSMNENFFLPQIAGVGFSYNLFAWNKDIDPKSGVLRLVFGLGTRAVNRSDDDYTRVIALNNPSMRPESGSEEIRKHSQKKVDVLDLNSNKLVSEYFIDIVEGLSAMPVNLFAEIDSDLERDLRERGGSEIVPWTITFNELVENTLFLEDIQKMLKTLQEAYKYPVDIEFTANFDDENIFQINLLQCRPYQAKMETGEIRKPGKIKKENLLFKTSGPIMGSSIHSEIDVVMFVVPAMYSKLPENDRYEIARVIGRVNGIMKNKDKNIMLMGPGRWGTSTPSLGVPVQFGEINNVSVLCEIAEMHEGLIPELSIGTHFFNDLVELDIQYLTINPRKEDNYLNRNFFETSKNQLNKMIPGTSKWNEVLKVIDLSATDKKNSIYLNVNSVEQSGTCFKDKKKAE